MRAAGAVPATIAVVDGEVRIGLDDDGAGGARRRATTSSSAASATCRSWSARGADGRHDGRRDRAPRRAAPASALFATGGLGGVHRGAPRHVRRVGRPRGAWPRTGICVVCAGVKSILDVPATLERLETLNVTVARLRGPTGSPAFYLADERLPTSPGGWTRRQEAAAIVARAATLARRAGRHRARQPAARGRAAGPRAARPGAREALAAAAERGRRGQRRHAVPARALPRADRRARACAANVAPGAAPTPRWPAESRAALADAVIVVVGDLMVDVVAATAAPLAHGSDTAARVSLRRGRRRARTSRRGWRGAARR